jgi:hypothetical protein
MSTFVPARREDAGRVAGAGRETAGAGRETAAGARKSDRAGIATGRRSTNPGSDVIRGAGRATIGTGVWKPVRAGAASGRRLANSVSAAIRGAATAGAGTSRARVPMRRFGPRAKSWGANRADGNGRRLAKRSIERAGTGTA